MYGPGRTCERLARSGEEIGIAYIDIVILDEEGEILLFLIGKRIVCDGCCYLWRCGWRGLATGPFVALCLWNSLLAEIRAVCTMLLFRR